MSFVEFFRKCSARVSYYSGKIQDSRSKKLEKLVTKHIEKKIDRGGGAAWVEGE